MKRLRFAVVLVPLLAACVGEQRERALGDQLATQLNMQLPLVSDPGVNRYVTSVGLELARASKRPDLPYHFYIIDSPSVNAFALPGGHIYLNRGLIERTENVSELAAVLGHEVGHVAARHGAEMVERRLRTGSLVTLMYRLVLGDEPSLLRESAIRMGSAAWSAGHSRADELEADELAVGYLVRAGLDPGGITSFLTGLMRDEPDEPGGIAPWFSTHPVTDERIERARREIREVPEANRSELARDVASYPRFLQRVRSLAPPPLPPGHPPIGEAP